MSTFILVHGSWHGAWAWDKVAPILRQAGHSVLVPDLPGHGLDATPASQVTLQSYADTLTHLLDSAREPAVLVGHSMGGIAISQAAEQRPDRIQSLVYLTAFMLRSGESLFQMAMTEGDSLLNRNLRPQEQEGTMWLNTDAAKEYFYDDCSVEDALRAMALLRPDPIAPVMTPLQLTPSSYGRVPRFYIEALSDRAISLATQRRMSAATPCVAVTSLDTSHSPMLSAPRALSAQLLAIATRVPVGI
jgi:pimeloyl-ACP methyl ester carboxylesterase